MTIFSTPEQKKPVCPVCKLAVPLETAKTDEDGRAVHEDCYLSSIKLKSQTVPRGPEQMA